jgi:hypothetical protein
MFGDNSNTWVADRSEMQREKLWEWLEKKSKLVVLEIGCGTSLHSISIESEALVREKGVKLIRINPSNVSVPAGPHVAIPLGAKLALVEIEKRIKLD